MNRSQMYPIVFLVAAVLWLPGESWAQGYWWKAPNLKYIEVLEDGTHGPSPHYWSFGGPSTSDSTLDQTYLYTSDSTSKTFFCQYVVQELRNANNADEVTFRWAIDHIFGLPKGSAQFGNRLVMGNGGEENVPFVGYPDDYTLSDKSESLLEADVSPNCDTLRFNHDGKYLYTNHYVGSENRRKLHRYKVTGSLEKDGQPFQLDASWQNGGTFVTSTARLRNFLVKYVGGKDLIYYGEGDSKTKASSLYVFDPESGKETVLVEEMFQVGEVNDADIVNVRIAGVKANDLHIYAMANIGGIKIYKLSSDGLKAENGGKPVAFVGIEDLNAITGTEAFSSHCRAFEVTDDQQYAFFSSHNASDRLFVINALSTAVSDWLQK